MDMFEERFSGDRVMDPAAGAHYRKCILVPGGSKVCTLNIQAHVAYWFCIGSI